MSETEEKITLHRNGKPVFRPKLPSFLMDAADLAELWGYNNVDVLYNAIARGSFPIPTFHHGKYLVADVEVVKAYFKSKRDQGLRGVRDAD